MDHPAEISNNRAARVLTIVWREGARQQWPHAQLRARCKCTQCQSWRLLGAPDQKHDDNVRVDALRIVGNYGLQLIFSDGHERGIFPWPYLRALHSEGPSASQECASTMQVVAFTPTE